MSVTGFLKPFIDISVTLSRSTMRLTLIQALNRTILNLGKLGELFRHTKLVKEVEEANAKCFRVGRPLDLKLNWGSVIDQARV